MKAAGREEVFAAAYQTAVTVAAQSGGRVFCSLHP